LSAPRRQSASPAASQPPHPGRLRAPLSVRHAQAHAMALPSGSQPGRRHTPALLPGLVTHAPGRPWRAGSGCGAADQGSGAAFAEFLLFTASIICSAATSHSSRPSGAAALRQATARKAMRHAPVSQPPQRMQLAPWPVCTQCCKPAHFFQGRWVLGHILTVAFQVVAQADGDGQACAASAPGLERSGAARQHRAHADGRSKRHAVAACRNADAPGESAPPACRPRITCPHPVKRPSQDGLPESVFLEPPHFP